jgi:hypothetical protein
LCMGDTGGEPVLFRFCKGDADSSREELRTEGRIGELKKICILSD